MGVWEAILGHFRAFLLSLSKKGVFLRKTKNSIFSQLGSGDGLDELLW